MKKNKISIILGLIIIASASGYFIWQYSQSKSDSPTKETTEKTKKQTKTIASITFGEWQPNETRTILGTVESPSDIEIVAENSGTIEKAFVNTGQKVSRGQILATYKTSNNLSQIQYNNALSNVQTTKASNESSIQTAQIALQNAEQEYQQSVITSKQNVNQSFASLTVNRESAETTVKRARDYIDRAFGISQRFQSKRDIDFEPIGRNNSLLKQKTKTLVQNLVNNYATYENTRWQDDFDYYRLSSAEKDIYRAEEIIDFLSDSKVVMENMIELIRQTNTSSSFSSSSRSTLQTEAENILGTVNNAIINLKNQKESARSTDSNQANSLVSTQNRIDAARTQLKLAEVNAAAQINAVQSQLRLAQKSQQDLEIRAPFDGIITEKMVNSFDRVNSGESLFSIVSEGSLPEIVASVTPAEWQLLSNKTEPLSVKLNGGDSITVQNITMNGKLSAASQKFSIKLLPSAEDIENKKIFIGSFAEIQLPLSNETKNLIPISAVSFEPGSTEILVLTTDEISKITAERRTVQTGKIIGNAIEILNGLEPEEQIVEYRQQVNSGEMVKIIE